MKHSTLKASLDENARRIAAAGKATKPTKHVSDDGVVDRVCKKANVSIVMQGKGYVTPGRVSCALTDTGNGFIALFTAVDCTRQDYYVCLDYAKARDLVLALSAFKSELGFEP